MRNIPLVISDPFLSLPIRFIAVIILGLPTFGLSQGTLSRKYAVETSFWV
jgi:hypothetical protein